MTNTNVNGECPYDNILYPISRADGLVGDGQFTVTNLIKSMREAWYQSLSTPYLADARYNHNAFRAHFSDHHPISFKLKISYDDD